MHFLHYNFSKKLCRDDINYFYEKTFRNDWRLTEGLLKRYFNYLHEDYQNTRMVSTNWNNLVNILV